MPKRSRTKSVQKKKPYKKRAQGDYRSIVIPRPAVTPNSIIVTLPYYYSSTFTSAALPTLYQQFRMNSIFDPDLTGVGHQPLGHDQWSALYMRYRVLESDITAMVSSNGATYPDNYEYCLNITETANAAASFAEAVEQPYSVWGITGYYVNDSPKLYKKVKASGMEGTMATKYEQDYSAAFGANPTQVFYANIYWNNTKNNRYEVFVQAKINYKVLIYDRSDLSMS